MTVERFIGEIQGYYGDKYTPGQIKYILQYLGKLTERALDHLFSLTLRTYSGRYGKSPDIAVWEGLREQVKDALQDEASQEHLMLEDQSDVITDEQREEMAAQLAGFGFKMGWAR